MKTQTQINCITGEFKEFNNNSSRLGRIMIKNFIETCNHLIVLSRMWKSYFSSPPYVVATCMSPTGVPLGNAGVHIISVSVKEIDFSINAYVPGMYVHLHAIGKWRD